MSDSRKRKQKANYYKQNKKNKFSGEDLKSHMKGFLISCGSNERQTVREAYSILNEYADKLYGVETFDDETKSENQDIIKDENADKNDDDEDIEAALQKQVSEVKKIASKETIRRFQSVSAKSKNIVFIKTTLENPTELVEYIFDDILKTKAGKTRNCLRFLPVVETCYARYDAILDTASEIIKKYFHTATKDLSFRVMWKSRCNHTVKREDCITEIAKKILECDQGHRVDYDNPDVVFNVDLVGNVCCFGILKNYSKYKKYNISLLVESNNTTGSIHCPDKDIEVEATVVAKSKESLANQNESMVEEEKSDTANKESVATSSQDSVKANEQEQDETANICKSDEQVKIEEKDTQNKESIENIDIENRKTESDNETNVTKFDEDLKVEESRND